MEPLTPPANPRAAFRAVKDYLTIGTAMSQRRDEMRRIDWYAQMIDFLWAKLAVSEGAVKVAVRAYLITLLTELCEMTGREGQEIV